MLSFLFSFIVFASTLHAQGGCYQSVIAQAGIAQEPTPVAIGILENAKGQVLLGERQPPQNFVGYWEFPGGKVEKADGSYEAALIREWKEEIGVDIRVLNLVHAQDRILGQRLITTRFYRVVLASPLETPRAIVHSKLRWVGPEDLDSVRFIVRNHPIWSVLGFPQRTN